MAQAYVYPVLILVQVFKMISKITLLWLAHKNYSIAPEKHLLAWF
jgi:hypothetical protein